MTSSSPMRCGCRARRTRALRGHGGGQGSRGAVEEHRFTPPRGEIAEPRASARTERKRPGASMRLPGNFVPIRPTPRCQSSPRCEAPTVAVCASGLRGLVRRHGNGGLVLTAVTARVRRLVDDGVRRPGPPPLRSARSRKLRSSVPNFAPWISSVVSPSPRPLSGSLLLIETSFTVGCGSQTSVTVIVAVIGTSLWLGGQSMVGDSESVRTGGMVFLMITFCVAVPLFPESSTAVQRTVDSPRGKPLGELLRRVADGRDRRIADVGGACLVAILRGIAHDLERHRREGPRALGLPRVGRLDRWPGRVDDCDLRRGVIVLTERVGDLEHIRRRGVDRLRGHDTRQTSDARTGSAIAVPADGCDVAVRVEADRRG